jgi:hypothetical protein
MKCLFILLLLIALSCTAFADCIITDTPYKFEVVCSGYDPTAPPTSSKKNTKNAKRSARATKANFESRTDRMPNLVMNEEEEQFAQTRNRQDGYRGNRKTIEQTTKKDGAA